MAQTASPSTDSQLFPLLDQYVEQLQQGSSPDRERLLVEHPELASAVRCLDALDKLAPRSIPPECDSSLGTIPTIALTAASGAVAIEGADAPAAVIPAKRRNADRVGPEAIAQTATGQPRVFGDYLLEAEIGRGGMGVVYRARQKSLDRTVALKMILANHLASQDQVRRFHAEAKAAAGLTHPNIVSIFEAGQVDGQHYFAMSYVEGESLADLLSQGPLPIDDAVEMLVLVARAVDHLHQHGIVHRDLKPGNILLDTAGRPYVTDFGLAKMLRTDSDRTATGVIAGTPSYMAPEQASGRGTQVGPPADVYSLGAILYELLTGKPPFQEDNPFDTLIQVLEKEPARPRQINAQISRKLELICLKCLEKSPEKRYASAAALADDLERYLRHEELQVRPPTPWQRVVRWARRQPALASRLAAFTACYAVESYNYFGSSSPVERQFHLAVTVIVLLWALASVLFQFLLRKPKWATAAIFAWAGADALLLLAVVSFGSGIASPLMVGYPILVAWAGLWYRVRLVWFAVAASLASYAWLVFQWSRDPAALGEAYRDPMRHAIYAIGMLVLGAVISYQVSRIKALSWHFEHRRN